MRILSSTCTVVPLAALVLQAALSAQDQPLDLDQAVETAEGTVTALYDLVSSEAGSTPDWGRVRSMFIPEAVIVLRTSRDSTTVFSLDGFIQDFVNFTENARTVETGFVERVLRTKTVVMGDMAHVWVLYEAFIPGRDRPPQQGVDSWLVIRKGGRWWVAAATNEIPRQGVAVPAELVGYQGGEGSSGRDSIAAGLLPSAEPSACAGCLPA